MSECYNQDSTNPNGNISLEYIEFLMTQLMKTSLLYVLMNK